MMYVHPAPSMALAAAVGFLPMMLGGIAQAPGWAMGVGVGVGVPIRRRRRCRLRGRDLDRHRRVRRRRG